MSDQTTERSDSGEIELSDVERRRRKIRNIAIGLSLAGLVVIFYIATLVRLGSNALNKPY
ncbi:MAG: hypothetical protein AAFO62_06955 [Pseudomonadota bacterium]